MKYEVETMPWAFSSPTGSSTSFFDAPTLLRMCSTFQPSFACAAIAWAENLGVVMLRNVSASLDASFAIWDDTVGSVTS
jgi:hypothetical protein